ncbi:toxin-antitoxin system, antitoxin component, Xre domain protein [Oesophagostomum dentatum]|uniref:Toxin-antitoxin system, antitoxin component, Xre domain protein n=1 Tax=Oesophagostomum dentatum TaxID=61180 RepID=A0A0B1S270_OESDE|nr:toxin-antitoxin system, antitoxin component, Xre domain protein [Oesophagostomum dentatum]
MPYRRVSAIRHVISINAFAKTDFIAILRVTALCRGTAVMSLADLRMQFEKAAQSRWSARLAACKKPSPVFART